MTGDSIASLIYLALLGCFIAGYFFVGRANISKSLQQAAIWALIFFGAAAGFALWSNVGDTVLSRQSVTIDGGSITVPRRGDGHYHITLGINGEPIEFIVDTGATDMVLSRRDAARAGIDPDALAYIGQAQTANGTVPLARVRIDTVSLGDGVERDVPASVNGGDMDGSLLGMSYLSRFGRIEIEGDTLTLTR